jgi:hypothetical protein
MPVHKSSGGYQWGNNGKVFKGKGAKEKAENQGKAAFPMDIKGRGVNKLKYRKKPVVIEAMQFTNEDKDRVFHWASEQQMNIQPSFKNGMPILIIPTLEGEMSASINDFIIKGVNGEFYPCKPDIFEKTYELME